MVLFYNLETMNTILVIGIGLGGLLIGGLVVFLLNRTLLSTRTKTILEEAEKEAEVIRKKQTARSQRKIPAFEVGNGEAGYGSECQIAAG